MERAAGSHGARALLACALTALLAFGVAPARAGSYTVWSCRGPDGTPISTQAWVPLAQDTATSDGCASGGGLSATVGTAAKGQGALAGYRFAMRTGELVDGYRIHLYAATRGLLGLAGAQAGMSSGGDPADPVVDAGCTSMGCEFGVLDPPLADANLLAARGLGSSGLVLAARCAAGFCDAIAPSNTELPAPVGPAAFTRLFAAQVDRRDDAAPQLSAMRGSLTSSEPRSGLQTLEADGFDGGAGITEATLLVDGSERDVHSGGCPEPFVIAGPCPHAPLIAFVLDTAVLAAGRHTAALRVLDGAGNHTTGPPLAFSVGQGPSLPVPAPGPGQGVAGTTDRETIVERRAEVAVPAARVRITLGPRALLRAGSGRVSGTVRLLDGTPAAGAHVALLSRALGPRRLAQRRELELDADADGRFSLPTGERSRELQALVDDPRYRGDPSAEVRVIEPLEVTVAVDHARLRNGASMTLTAKLAGTGGGARGKSVLVETIVRRRWTTVAALQSDDRGRARWHYTFAGTSRPARYSFRVRVEHTGDVWPWPTTVSDVVLVRVRP